MKYIFVNNENGVATIVEDRDSFFDNLGQFEKDNIDFSIYTFSKSMIEILEKKGIKFALEVEDILYFNTYREYCDYCNLYF